MSGTVWICFRILSLKTKDTSSSSWLFDFVAYSLVWIGNEGSEIRQCPQGTHVYHITAIKEGLYKAYASIWIGAYAL